MSVPELRRDGETVVVLDLGDDENRFSPDWLSAVEGLLDEVVADPGPVALLTVGGGRFYANGLDLDWLGSHGDQLESYVADVQRLFARVLTLPVPTVAAVNGHAFGAGAMLALAHDFRFMREDRGYFCLPEVDMGITFSPGMAALVQAKLTPSAAVASMTTGRRFGAADAQALGMVDGTAGLDELVGRAAAFVRPLAGKDRATLGAVKTTMYGTVVDALTGKVL